MCLFLRNMRQLKKVLRFVAGSHVNQWVFLPAELLRMVKKTADNQEVRLYVRSAREAIVLNTAAQAWARGVPWEEALQISQRAMSVAGRTAGSGKGKGTGKGKAKPKAKAKGR